MTTISDSDYRRVRGLEDVRDLFYPEVSGDFKPRCGTEEEGFYVYKDNLQPIKDATNVELVRRLKAMGISTSPEPSPSQLEHVTDAYTYEELGKVCADMHEKRVAIHNVCESLGIMRVPMPSIPHVSSQQALSEYIQPTLDDKSRGVRQKGLMTGPFQSAVLSSEGYDYPVKNTVIHYTCGVRDMDEKLKNGRRKQFLQPAIILLMENRSPFDYGTKNRHTWKKDISQSMRARLVLGARGGIDNNYFNANTGDELAQLEYEDIISHPMFARYLPMKTESGSLKSDFELLTLGKQSVPSFAGLIEEGSELANRSNFLMARSLMWRWLKSKNTFENDAEQNINAIGLLLEVRDIDTGIFQADCTPLIYAPMDFDPDFAGQVDDLLAKYGFDSDNYDDNGLLMLERARFSAYYRGNERIHGNSDFLNIPYGSGNMHEFIKEFVDMLDQYYAKNIPQLRDQLRPLKYIAETGNTDAQIAKRLITNPSDNEGYLRAHDPAWMLEPSICLGERAEMGDFTFGKDKPLASTVFTPQSAGQIYGDHAYL